MYILLVVVQDRFPVFLERLVTEVTCYVLSVTLNYSVTHYLVQCFRCEESGRSLCCSRQLEPGSRQKIKVSTLSVLSQDL